MNAKRASPPPKPDRDHAQGKKKITRRVKESAYEYYESELAKGKQRDQILERLGKQHDRSAREMERWISEIRENKKLEQNIKEARQQHWNDLADTAAKAAKGFYLRFVADFDFLHLPVGKTPRMRNKDTKPSPSVGMRLSEAVLEILHPLEPSDWKKSLAHQLGSTTRKHSLIVHLDFEFKGFNDKLRDWKRCALCYQRCKISGDEAELPYKPSEIEARLQNLTSEIIEVLTKVAERRTFKGKCEICKDW